MEVVNGLLGLLRNILLRLCSIMGNDVGKIRMIIGLCEENLTWRFHSYFIEKRIRNMILLLPPPTDRMRQSFFSTKLGRNQKIKKVGHYILREKLNGGGGEVFLGEDDRTAERLAIKTYYIDTEDFRRQMNTALSFFVQSRSRYLVRYRDVVPAADEDPDCALFLVMEYCAGGTMDDCLRERKRQRRFFTDAEILRIVYEVGNGLRALHQQGIFCIHLHPENILLDAGGECRIGSYGIPKRDPMTVFSISYFSPEVVDGQNKKEASADIYSFGIVIVELIDLLHPFVSVDGRLEFLRIFREKPNPPRDGLGPVADAVRRFALRMIALDPSARPTLDALFTTLFPLFRAYYPHLRESLRPLPPPPPPPPPSSGRSLEERSVE